jgi:hypothetical protein
VQENPMRVGPTQLLQVLTFWTKFWKLEVLILRDGGSMLLTARAPSSCLVKGAIFLENCTLAYWHFAVFDQRWQYDIAWSTIFILTSTYGVNLQIWGG